MNLLGVTLSETDLENLLKQIAHFIDIPTLHHIVTVNPEYLVEAHSNRIFKQILNEADIATVDGIGVVLALEYLMTRKEKKDSLFFGILQFLRQYLAYVISPRQSIIRRISGIDLIWSLVQQDFMRGRRIYLIGGRDNVSAQAAKRLSQYNEFIQFRTSNGLIDVRNPGKEEERRIIEDINSFNPDVLLVAYGHPWQDIWISQHKDQLKARLAIGVGGSFDYIAQKVPRAPSWMRTLGLEWLFRLFNQPKRFTRIVRATFVFIRLIIST